MLKNFSTIFNFKHSIFARLFIILLVVFTVAFVISTSLWYTNTSNLIYTSYTYHLSDIINRSNNKFEEDLYTITRLVQSIATSESTVSAYSGSDLNGSDSYRTYLNEFLNLYTKTLDGILVTDNTGKTISAGKAYASADYMQSSWYKDILDGRGTCRYIISESPYSTSQKQLTVGCAVMSDRDVIGIVLVNVSNSVYISSFGANAINGSMRTIIFTDNEDVIFSNDSSLSDDTISKLFEGSRSQKYSSTLSEVSIDKKTYLFSYQKNTYTGWTNVTFFDKDIIDAEYRKVIIYTMLFIVLTLAVTAVIAAVISYAFSKKLHRLTSEIDSVNLEYINDCTYNFETGSSDEIGIISENISNMIEKISGQFNEIRELTEQKRLSDIYMLKSQINPHFLYNALNSIESLARLHNDKPIRELTCSLIDLLHYSINTDNQLVDIAEELNYIRNYIEVMQNKFLDRINVVYDIEPGLESCKTQRMILQPIVENCIKHAFNGVVNKRIFIKAAVVGNDVNITVTDNGNGAPPELTEQLKNNSIPGGHYGLINVNKRIQLAFGEDYGLSILPIPGVQTSVIIKVPYINTQEE